MLILGFGDPMVLGYSQNNEWDSFLVLSISKTERKDFYNAKRGTHKRYFLCFEFSASFWCK